MIVSKGNWELEPNLEHGSCEGCVREMRPSMICVTCLRVVSQVPRLWVDHDLDAIDQYRSRTGAKD